MSELRWGKEIKRRLENQNLQREIVHLILVLINMEPVQEVFCQFDVSGQAVTEWILYYKSYLDQLSFGEDIPQSFTSPVSLLPAPYLRHLNQLPEDLQEEPTWNDTTEKSQAYIISFCTSRLQIIMDWIENPTFKNFQTYLEKESNLFSQSEISGINAGLDELISPIRWEVTNATLAKMLCSRPGMINYIFGNDLEYAHPELKEQIAIIDCIGSNMLSSVDVQNLKFQIHRATISPIDFFSKDAILHNSGQFYKRIDKQLYFRHFFTPSIDEPKSPDKKLTEFIKDFSLDNQGN